MSLKITGALFDFDGTISLVREGWQPIMTQMMVEILLKTPRHEPEDQLTKLVSDYIDELTGRQTMYQMIRLAEEVEKRGGMPEDPSEYKKRYIELLEKHIADRLESLRTGHSDPADFFVPGAKEFLELLHAQGVALYLASGTDEHFVRREAQLLGVANLFKTIAGAQEQYLTFSKKIAIERILRENAIDGTKLAVFGDGFVEIEEAKKVGAFAIGVASDEVSRSGQINEWKQRRLTDAGADLIVPDFSDPGPIFTLLAA